MIEKYLKAATGAVAAALGSLITALADGQVVAVEWATMALAGVLALGGVWAVPNRETVPFDRIPTTRRE